MPNELTSAAPRKFPILEPYPARGAVRHFVPWPMVAPHEAQALRTHSQTLERLAQRGGLGWVEMIAVLDDMPAFDLLGPAWENWEALDRLDAESKAKVLARVAEWEAANANANAE